MAGCDGRLPRREQLSLLAVAHDVPEADIVAVAAPIVTHLVERGFLSPVPAVAR